MQVAPIGPATQDASAVEHQQITFWSSHFTAAITQGQIQPAIVPGDDPVGVVQPNLVLLRPQAEAFEEILSLVRLAVSIRVTQRGEIRRVHDEHGPVVVRQSLNRIEPIGPYRSTIGVAVAISVFDEPNLVALDDVGRPQSSHVIGCHEQSVGSWPQRDCRWVFDQWIAGEKRRLESCGKLQWRESFLGFRPGLRRFGGDSQSTQEHSPTTRGLKDSRHCASFRCRGTARSVV